MIFLDRRRRLHHRPILTRARRRRRLRKMGDDENNDDVVHDGNSNGEDNDNDDMAANDDDDMQEQEIGRYHQDDGYRDHRRRSASPTIHSGSMTTHLLLMLLVVAMLLNIPDALFEANGMSSYFQQNQQQQQPPPPTINQILFSNLDPISEQQQPIRPPAAQQLSSMHSFMSTNRAGPSSDVNVNEMTTTTTTMTTVRESSSSRDIQSNNEGNDAPATGRCAILFWGLPRAYRSLVLPSIQRNIVQPNVAHNCDYYVHYYDLKEEVPGRSGSGGSIQPDDILQLQTVIEQVHADADPLSHRSTPNTVLFIKDEEQDFWNQYDTLIQQIRTTKDEKGNLLYFPWKAKTYKFPVTTDNIVKMWHTIQSVYQLMDRTAQQRNIRYTRIGMFRSDVVYVTPIDIYLGGPHLTHDVHNQYVMVPAFAQYPVNDRAIYGPAPAVHIWATERFTRLEQHVYRMDQIEPGWGLHSEKFVANTLFPMIRALGKNITLMDHPTMCFMRARSDESVWISDCSKRIAIHHDYPMHVQPDNPQGVVEQAIGRTCGTVTSLHRMALTLDCSQAAEQLETAQR